MTPDTNKERAEFEAWMPTIEGYPFARQFANLMWKSYQAGRAAKAPAAEPGHEPDGAVAVGAWAHLRLMMGHSAFAGKLELDDALANISDFAKIYTAPPAPTEQWVSVAERLPNPHQDVLLVIDGGHVTTGSYMPSLHCFCWEPCDDEREDSAVTHWMTKPAPPQGAANKDES